MIGGVRRWTSQWNNEDFYDSGDGFRVKHGILDVGANWRHYECGYGCGLSFGCRDGLLSAVIKFAWLG